MSDAIVLELTVTRFSWRCIFRRREESDDTRKDHFQSSLQPKSFQGGLVKLWYAVFCTELYFTVSYISLVPQRANTFPLSVLYFSFTSYKRPLHLEFGGHCKDAVFFFKNVQRFITTAKFPLSGNICELGAVNFRAYILNVALSTSWYVQTVHYSVQYLSTF
jgi:hypothetical protein